MKRRDREGFSLVRNWGRVFSTPLMINPQAFAAMLPGIEAALRGESFPEPSAFVANPGERSEESGLMVENGVAVLGVYGYMDSLTAGQMAGQTVTYPNFYSCTTTNCNVYTANCSASGAGGGPAPAAVVAASPPIMQGAAPSAASRQALHAAAMLLAALMVIALQ